MGQVKHSESAGQHKTLACFFPTFSCQARARLPPRSASRCSSPLSARRLSYFKLVSCQCEALRFGVTCPILALDCSRWRAAPPDLLTPLHRTHHSHGLRAAARARRAAAARDAEAPDAARRGPVVRTYYCSVLRTGELTDGRVGAARICSRSGAQRLFVLALHARAHDCAAVWETNSCPSRSTRARRTWCVAPPFPLTCARLDSQDGSAVGRVHGLRGRAGRDVQRLALRVLRALCARTPSPLSSLRLTPRPQLVPFELGYLVGGVRGAVAWETVQFGSYVVARQAFGAFRCSLL